MLTSTVAQGTASATEFTMRTGALIITNYGYSKHIGTTVSMSKPLQLRSIELIGNIAPGWKLIRTLPVSVDIDEEGHFLLADDMFSIFGEGDNIADAQRDLVTSLIEYYNLISEYEDEPSRELLGMLRKYLQPTPAFFG